MFEPYWTMAKTFATHRWYAARQRMREDGEGGMSTVEVATITLGLLVAAGILIAAIKGKLNSLIGSITST